MIFDGFDTGLIVSKDAEQDLPPMYKIRISRGKSRLLGEKSGFRHEESLPALSFLTFPFLVNSNLTLMNIEIEDGQWMRERGRSFQRLSCERACSLVRCRTCACGEETGCAICVHATRKHRSQLTFGDFYDGFLPERVH